jgi:hypothetical protein
MGEVWKATDSRLGRTVRAATDDYLPRRCHGRITR